MSVNIQDMPPQIQQRYTDKMLSTPERNLIHNLFSSVIEIPDNNGFIDRQSRYDRLDTFEVPLGDQQLNPPEQLLNRVDVDARVRNYATYVTITKQVMMTNQDRILNNAAARLGQAYKETSDILSRDNLESSASIVNCVGGTNNDLPTNISDADCSDIVSLLQNNDGDFVTNMIGAEMKIGTSPIGDSYGAMCTTRMIPSLQAMPQFTKKFAYPNIKDTLSVEWGGINNIRFFVSSQGSVTPNASLAGNDIANIFITAKEGYKTVFQTGGRAKFYYTPPGTNNDPAFLRSTAACGFYQGNAVNNDLWVQNLRATGI